MVDKIFILIVVILVLAAIAWNYKKEWFEGFDLNVIGDAAGFLKLNNNLNVAGNVNAGNVTTGSVKTSGDASVGGNLTVTGTLSPGAISITSLPTLNNIGTKGDANIGGNMNVVGIISGNYVAKNDAWNQSADGVNRNMYIKGGRTIHGTANGYEWHNKSDQPILSLDEDGTLNVTKLKIGNNVISG